jgi:hypothetical protein
MDEEILTIAEKIDTRLEHAIHINDLQSYVKTLKNGDAVYIIERTENPHTKFGTVSMYKKWRVVKKFPFTVQIEKTGNRGVVYTRCLPYQQVMIEQREYLKAVSRATDSMMKELAGDLDEELEDEEEIDEYIVI